MQTARRSSGLWWHPLESRQDRLVQAVCGMPLAIARGAVPHGGLDGGLPPAGEHVAVVGERPEAVRVGPSLPATAALIRITRAAWRRAAARAPAASTAAALAASATLGSPRKARQPERRMRGYSARC
jgi:hypothetical protein